MAKRFISLAEIKAHQFVGNYASDMAAFEAIRAFVADANNSIADRAEAIRHSFDYGMGMDRMDGVPDVALIAEYLEEDCGDDVDTTSEGDE